MDRWITREQWSKVLVHAYGIIIRKTAVRLQHAMQECVTPWDDGFRYKTPTICVRRTTSNVFTDTPKITRITVWFSRTAAISAARSTPEKRLFQRQNRAGWRLTECS